MIVCVGVCANVTPAITVAYKASLIIIAPRSPQTLTT
jgi:hypothetical protein